MNTPSQPDHRAEVLALSKRLTDLVGDSAISHERCMDALLLAYATLAMANPCCTQGAASAAMRTSIYLTTAAGAVPAGAAVH